MMRFAILALFTAVSSFAITIDFSWTGFSSGSGVMTTNDTPNLSGFYTITSISGLYNGNAISSLLPPGSIGGNDNLIILSSPQLDPNGFSFTTNSTATNIYFGQGNYEDIQTGQINFKATQDTSRGGTPEPATLGGLRRLRHSTCVAADS